MSSSNVPSSPPQGAEDRPQRPTASMLFAGGMKPALRSVARPAAADAALSSSPSGTGAGAMPRMARISTMVRQLPALPRTNSGPETRLSRYILGARLGGGAFGQVFAATRPDMEGAAFAIKFIMEAKYDAEDTVLQAMSHPNVLPILESFLEKDVPEVVLQGAGGRAVSSTASRSRYCYVLPMASHGDLSDFVKRCEGGRLLERDFWRILLHLARGLDYLHSQNIVHSDIKPENVLISEGEGFMLADFGTAGHGTHEESEAKGTIPFMSPQTCRDPYPLSGRQDTWSLGATLWSLLTGPGSTLWGDAKTMNARKDAAFKAFKERTAAARKEIAALSPAAVRAELSKRKLAFSTLDQILTELTERGIAHKDEGQIRDMLEHEKGVANPSVEEVLAQVSVRVRDETVWIQGLEAVLAELLAQVMGGDFWAPPPLADPSLSTELREVVNACLSWDPSARPTPKELLHKEGVQRAAVLVDARDDPTKPITVQGRERAALVASALKAHGLTADSGRLPSQERLQDLVAVFRGAAPFSKYGAVGQIVPNGLIPRQSFVLLLKATGLDDLVDDDAIEALEVGHAAHVSWKDFVAGIAALSKVREDDPAAHMRVALDAFQGDQEKEADLNSFDLYMLASLFGIDTAESPAGGETTTGIDAASSTAAPANESAAPSSNSSNASSSNAASSSSSSNAASSSSSNASATSSNSSSNSSASTTPRGTLKKTKSSYDHRKSIAAALFRAFDIDDDGVITRTEFEAALADQKPCTICGVAVARKEYEGHYNACQDRVFREKAGALATTVSPAVAALFERRPPPASPPADNAALVAPRLYVGNQWAATSEVFIPKTKVRCILNCAKSETSTLSEAQQKALHIREVRGEDIFDISDVDYTSQLAQGADHVRDLLKIAEPDGSVLVHCVQGISRSASVAIAYLVRHGNMTLLDAATQMRERRWQSMPNQGFWSSLRRIEMEARGGVSSVPEEAISLHRNVVFLKNKVEDHPVEKLNRILAEENRLLKARLAKLEEAHLLLVNK